MTQIAEEHIGKTAGLLEIAADTAEGTSFPSVISASSSNLPSVESGFNAFKDLPETHLLKRIYDAEKVKAGYERLKELGLDPAGDYNKLRNQIFIP